MILDIFENVKWNLVSFWYCITRPITLQSNIMNINWNISNMFFPYHQAEYNTSTIFQYNHSTAMNWHLPFYYYYILCYSAWFRMYILCHVFCSTIFSSWKYISKILVLQLSQLANYKYLKYFVWLGWRYTTNSKCTCAYIWLSQWFCITFRARFHPIIWYVVVIEIWSRIIR